MLSIFVSSTFSDMQAERDIIRQRVLPRLQRVASKYGESVRIIDLRWGVNTTAMPEKQATEKIMDVCFEQIDKCNGRMLCLLGNRYGWIPEYDFNEINNRYGLNLSSRVSATELEIQYGVLKHSYPHKAMVFIRDEIKSLPNELTQNFSDNNPRLEVLKRNLLQSSSCICRNYSLEYLDDSFDGLNDFEELVFSVLCEYILSEFNESNLDYYDKIKKHFDSRIDEETQNYFPHSSLDNIMSQFICSRNSIGLLKANAGMGKTAYTSYFCSQEKNARKIFYFFCGHNADSESPLQLLNYFIYHVSKYLGICVDNTSGSIQESAHVFTYLIEQFDEEVVFVVDGIDHLVCSYDDRFAWFPKQIPDNVKFLISTLTDDSSYEHLNRIACIQVITIPQLENPVKFIRHLLLTNGKDIQEDVLSAALIEHKIENYYYAKMIADALTMMDRYDFQNIKNSGDGINAINKFILDTVKTFPRNIEGMALFLLHDFGNRIAPNIIPQVYIYIACNSIGLRAFDLEKIFGEKWDDVFFEKYIAFLSGIIIEKENGCYDFSSNIIRNAVEKLIKWKDRKTVIKHIEKLPDDDPLKLRCCLENALWYENYEVVYTLITNNNMSEVLAEQFMACLNYAENEMITLFKKYDLYDWFFCNILSRVCSSQQREACIRIITNILRSIPPNLVTTAYEYLGDSYAQKGEYIQARQYYTSAANGLDVMEPETKGRILYKLASILPVNSDEEYTELRNVLLRSVNNFENASIPLDITHRMLFIAAKHQLMLLEINYKLDGISTIQVFNSSEMRLQNGWQTPHLGYISKKKIGEIKEEVVDFLKHSVDQFNQYRRESESIFQNAVQANCIQQIIELFILTLNTYDVFGIPLGRIERLKELKLTLEEKIKERFSLTLYQSLGEVEYILAGDEDDLQLKIQHLLSCCAIWGQFITQSSLPSFTEKYINAEMELVKLSLSAGTEEMVEEHIAKWSQARFDFIINELKLSLKECKRYPDEMHMELLKIARSEVADVNSTKTRVKCLGEKYINCQNIGLQYYYHLIKSRVFKHIDAFEAREKFSYKYYYWLKNVYLELNSNGEQGKYEKKNIGFVCVYVLELMLRMLELISDIPVNRDDTHSFNLENYYNERVFVLEERHKFEMQRLEKIWYGYMYAKSLVHQANNNEKIARQNFLFASQILNTLKKILYENEITPYNLAYPTVSRNVIDFDLCIVEISLAMHYKEIGFLLLSAQAYETATSLSLSLMGIDENSGGDYIYLKIAKTSCLQAIKLYNECEIINKVIELGERYEAIETLGMK